MTRSGFWIGLCLLTGCSGAQAPAIPAGDGGSAPETVDAAYYDEAYLLRSGPGRPIDYTAYVDGGPPSAFDAAAFATPEAGLALRCELATRLQVDGGEECAP